MASRTVEPGEFVAAVTVPKLRPNQAFRAFKISKRFDQDISALLGAFCLTLDGGRIAEARIAFGGMAPTPKRALRAEAALKGADLNDASSWNTAIAALDQDFKPIGDHRASAAYRQATARALLTKALHEIAGAPTQSTRITGQREALHAGAA